MLAEKVILIAHKKVFVLNNCNITYVTSISDGKTRSVASQLKLDLTKLLLKFQCVKCALYLYMKNTWPTLVMNALDCLEVLFHKTHNKDKSDNDKILATIDVIITLANLKTDL